MGRTASVVLVLVVLASGCARLGFGDRDASAPVDLSRDAHQEVDLEAVDGSADASGDAVALAGLNEPCNPPACAAGLVCTGTGPVDHCRPACTDSSDCSPGEVCGRPAGNLTVPMACLSVVQSKLYEECVANSCEDGLVCASGDEKVCLRYCAGPSDCGSSETCIPMGSLPLSLCHPQCTTDQDCPSSLLRCTGFGPYPGGYCTPTIPKGANEACGGGAQCKAGLRCVGTPGWAFCYPVCPQGGGCLQAQTCVTRNQEGICLTSCTPLDSPVKCNTHEVCYPDPALAAAYCLPAQGDASTCTSSVPCVSGKICVSGACLQVCDATHPCPTSLSCLPLSFRGSPGPWSACK